MSDPRISKAAEVLLLGLVQNDRANDGKGKVVFRAFGTGSPINVTSRTITDPIWADVPLMTELMDGELIAKYGNTFSRVDYRFTVTEAGHEYVASKRPTARAVNVAAPIIAAVAGGIAALLLFPDESFLRRALIVGFGALIGAFLGRALVRAQREGVSVDTLLAAALALMGIVLAIAALSD